MNTHRPRLAEQAAVRSWLAGWRGQLVSRRRFLLRLAGGSLTALFPLPSLTADRAATELDKAARWQLLDAVQQHLFPDAPGAVEIKALDYLRFIVADGSFMPTGGSVPYTWTIYANAFRVAEGIDERL